MSKPSTEYRAPDHADSNQATSDRAHPRQRRRASTAERQLQLQHARTLPHRRPRRWPSATRVPAAAPAPGRIVAGRYTLLREIGEGTCGTVFEAHDSSTQRRVAVKVASGVFAASVEGMARFQREAVAAASIGHEGIVAVLDSGRDDDGLQYIVMEYLEGTDLAGVIERDGPLSVERTLEIAIGVADALAAAHRAGVVHRDLKPANVYLQQRDDGSEVVKLIDFGVSKLRNVGSENLELTGPGHILGSPSYMAPEQARGLAVIDGRADIYALGILIYELLTRRPPFAGDSPMEVIYQQISEPPAPLSDHATAGDIPRALEELVARALAKDPGDRFPSMDEMRAGLEQVLEHERGHGKCRVLGLVTWLAAAWVGALSSAR